MSAEPHADAESDSDPFANPTADRPPLGDAAADQPAGWGTEARRTGRLFLTLLYRRGILLVRYPVDTVGVIVSTFLLFVVLFLGGRAVGGPQFGDSLGGLVVGYLVWLTALTAFQDVRTTVTEEAQWGTLERLYLSPLGFGRVMVLEGVVNVLYSFLWAAALLPPLLVVTGESLAVDLLTVVPVALLGLLSVLGVGLAFGGLAVVYKRVGSLASLFQFALLGFVAIPVEAYPATRLLPLVQANYLLGQAMREGVGLWEFAPGELAALAGVAAAYLLGGYLCFGLFARLARRRGVLGHY